jgi:hypothetical protein
MKHSSHIRACRALSGALLLSLVACRGGTGEGATTSTSSPATPAVAASRDLYDHGVVEHATARGDVMVFCKVTGALDAPRLKEAVRRVRGVEPQSVRVAAQPAAMSFAVDPRVRSPQAAVAAAQRSMAAGTRLSIVSVRWPGTPSD